MRKYRFLPRTILRYSGKKIYRYLSDTSALYSAAKQSSPFHSSGSLLILDDLFPFLGTGFRVAEFSAYLSHWLDAEVHIDTKSAVWQVYTDRQKLQTVADRYAQNHPTHRARIKEYNVWRQLNFSMGYNVFLNLAAQFVHIYEKNNIPFVFTLYPGGGFKFNDAKSDANLKRVFGSPMFRKVITTQTITTDYLLTNDVCAPSDIVFIFGVPLLTDFRISTSERKRFGVNKPTFDVCFVANRYSPQGKDKGYDLFVEVVRSLKNIPDIQFHVVGTFTVNDVDVQDLATKIQFYGIQPNHFFSEFYKKMDVIVSPNRAFVLDQGAFDGFPTGACAEAALQGVVVICTDPLGLNQYFDDSEIILIRESSGEITEHINRLHSEPNELIWRSQRGQEKFERLYSTEAQITPRIRLLSEYLK
jgi:glycosyltransferase involved in cell wall biosynthesis